MKRLVVLFFILISPTLAQAQDKLLRKMAPAAALRLAGFQDVKPKDVKTLAELYHRFGWQILQLDDDPSDGEMSCTVGENVIYDWSGFSASGTPSHALRFLFLRTTTMMPAEVEAVFNSTEEYDQFVAEAEQSGFQPDDDGEHWRTTVNTAAGRQVEISIAGDRLSYLPKLVLTFNRY